ncbi:MAG: hypothetical protein ACI9RU_002134, partial [Litorivivens sp.]
MKTLTLLGAVLVTMACTAQADVRITLIDPTTNEVQLTNLGDANLDVGPYSMCNFPSYDVIATLTALDTDIDPGSSLSFIWPALLGSDGESGLYSSSSFGSSAAMVDYVEWGNAGHFREGVAIGANVWFAGEFISGTAAMAFIGGAGDYGSAFWAIAQSNVRIAHVDLNTNTAQLKNFGTVEQDISGWFLCNFPSYLEVQLVSNSIGDFDLSPGESVLVEWSSLNGFDGEVALYNINVFSSSAAIEDYVQWGSASHQREPVAVAAGVWNSGEFIDGGSPFSFTGGGSDVGVSFWNYSILGCTYTDATNYDSTATEDDG